MPIRAHFFQRAILTGKVGQSGLDFGVQSGFISGSESVRLQVSVYSVTICATLVIIQTRTHSERQIAFCQLI